MNNMCDYLIWRGDLSFKQDEFNEIDSLILARVSYLPFNKITLKKIETFKSISEKMEGLKDKDFKIKGDKPLIKLLGECDRFKDLEITNYVKTDDRKSEKQFGAVTIHLSDYELYISFLGTDGSITGWKEDFNMSFMDDVACQVEGKKYLQRINDKYPSKYIRIGGHSKGGNVSIYSAFTASNKVKDKIIKVYNYDGPGFSNNLINKYMDEELLKKIESFIPEESIIGRILNHEEKINIVKSSNKGIMQHDVYSWLLSGKKLIYADSVSNGSEDFDGTLKEWLSSTTREERKIFFDTVFDLFYSSEKNSFDEISKDFISTLPRMMRKYSGLSKAKKNNLSNMIGLFIKKYIDVFGRRGKLKIVKNKN